MRAWPLLLAVALLWACSSEASSGSRGEVNDTAGSCAAGASQACGCPDGSSGTQSCGQGTWLACQCSSGAAGSFGNPSGMATADGGGVAAPAPATVKRENCDPGFYLGTYECPLDLNGLVFPLMGDVSFNLEVSEETVLGQCGPSDEFCADLVIAEDSGVLYGLAGFIGFEAQLEGGLDCRTGEFRTPPFAGIYGSPVSSDPNDPNAPLTVQQPSQGTFTGELSGMHVGGMPQVIEGEWNLQEGAGMATCVGAFSVTRQP